MKHDHIICRRPFQIQPQYSSRLQWTELAEKEDLAYEVIEFSMPPALSESRRYQVLEWQQIQEWYRNEKRVVSFHGAFIDVNPASGDFDFCALSQKRMKESCALAVLLGAENIVFHSSCCTFLRGIYLDLWAGGCAAFFEKLAENYPLRFFIENSQDIDTTPLKELMRRISNPRISVCLDLGHVNYSRAPLEQWFEDLAPWIGYLHLSDNMGLSDDHLPLGTGTVDWKNADRLWRMTGRRMPMTLETGGPEDVKQSLRFLEENGYFGYAEN